MAEKENNLTDESVEQESAENSAEPGEAAQPQETELATLLEDARNKADENWNLCLRLQADLDNLHKRSERDLANAHKFALERFAQELLPVRDSLEATTAIADASNEQLLQGVHATLKLLTQALERNRVVEINPPAGTRFDPHQHQAISMVPAEQEANTIVAVLQKGYLIAERVLRPALVTVAAPK